MRSTIIVSGNIACKNQVK